MFNINPDPAPRHSRKKPAKTIKKYQQQSHKES